MIIGGQAYNVTGTGGLFQLGLARFILPFVDRLGDRKTSFLYIPAMFTDNVLALLTGLLMHTDAYLSSIQPPMGSKQAFYVDGKNLRFSAHGKKNNSSGITFDGEAIPFSHLPWPADSFFKVANQPGFGPKSDKCFYVRTVRPSRSRFLIFRCSTASSPLAAISA